ncbi:bifunctional riboflavin kinase/FAD synthetase [Rubricoccus marinus]|uniref:Riboflavin biosynthesis protein n=1 Tax=Rubricoccus marinus TaxID=716817 RepID=A0A259TXZ6_9BACT|nr:bifunctional riboflavin kinase/FAD synthetase [Rubricoccus marinus]OZC02566.1 riboflavin biosynthesis protein RibF [Rubricoccus marinus]
MRIEVGPEISRDDRSVLTTGTFDGVHLGHRAIIRYLVDRAAKMGGVPTLVTFDPHPREVIAGVHVPLLTTMDERAALARALGIERFVVLPFTRDLSNLEPEDYIADVLLGQIGMKEIVVGYDHRFGRRARGDRDLLDALGAEHHFSVDVIPEQIETGVTVSSTEIRQRLATGDVERAAHLLGRPYRFSGTVVHGEGRGRTIGFPTANVQLEHDRKMLPAIGVYAVRASVAGSALAPEASGDNVSARVQAPTVRHGMMNIGKRPTFEVDGAVKAEVHLFETDADLYGRRLSVDVVARIRGEKPFDGPQALVRQLKEDRQRAQWMLVGSPEAGSK